MKKVFNYFIEVIGHELAETSLIFKFNVTENS